jgi:hypothetical protein
VKVALKGALIVVAVGLVFVVVAAWNLFSSPWVGQGVPAVPGEQRVGQISDEARQRLDAEGLWLAPKLDEVRVSGDITTDSVERALIAAGYTDRNVRTTWLASQVVAFSVEFEDGCLSGTVSAAEVGARAAGQYPSGGCALPETP